MTKNHALKTAVRRYKEIYGVSYTTALKAVRTPRGNNTPHHEKAIQFTKELLAKDPGIILIAGGTASGKTTLQTHIANTLAPSDYKIVVIEDPQEPYQYVRSGTAITGGASISKIVSHNPALIVDMLEWRPEANTTEWFAARLNEAREATAAGSSLLVNIHSTKPLAMLDFIRTHSPELASLIRGIITVNTARIRSDTLTEYYPVITPMEVNQSLLDGLANRDIEKLFNLIPEDSYEKVQQIQATYRTPAQKLGLRM